MENIKTLLLTLNPHLKDVRITEEHYEEDGRIKYVFENGEKIITNTNSLIDEIIGLIIKK
jgi:hypothetical protein